jgi:hypothetical protein
MSLLKRKRNSNENMVKKNNKTNNQTIKNQKKKYHIKHIISETQTIFEQKMSKCYYWPNLNNIKKQTNKKKKKLKIICLFTTICFDCSSLIHLFHFHSPPIQNMHGQLLHVLIPMNAFHCIQTM